MQWAAVITHLGSMSTPPHQWPMKPNFGCSNWRDTCQGHEPLLLGLPLKMRPVVVVVVEDAPASFNTCTFDDTIERGCLCDAAGHPHSVIQSRLYSFNAFARPAGILSRATWVSTLKGARIRGLDDLKSKCSTFQGFKASRLKHYKKTYHLYEWQKRGFNIIWD